ncbi:MAG: pyridoxal phosphate-dependent aminotransferase [Planctomycetota bacterium]|jgi:aspartate aminotransferase
MTSPLSRRAQAITPSATLAISARAKELKAQGVDVVAFAAGEPDFDTPAYITKAAHEAIDAGKTRYTPAAGTPELKAAIAKKLKEDNGLDYAAGEIIVSCGAKHSLANIVLAMIDDGDEVLLPAPYWVSYPQMVRLAGGVVRVLPTKSEDGFKVTPKQVAEACTERTKLFIFNSPSNPTGAVYTPGEIAELGKVLLEKGVWCLSDEIYEKLLYDGLSHESIAAVVPEMKARTVVVNGHSKAYAMTGWRIGYAAGPAEVIKAASSMQSHTTSNPASVSQAAATAALSGGEEVVEEMRCEFERRRTRIVEGLRAIPGVKVPVAPQGAFYVFPDVSGLYGKGAFADAGGSIDFAKVCLEKVHVAVVPGEAFGEDRCVRLSYATAMESIEEGLRRLSSLAG